MVTTSDNALTLVKQAHIIQRLYTSPLVSEFGSSVPIKQPGGRIFFLSRVPEKKFDNSLPDSNSITQFGWGDAPEGTKVSTYKFKILSQNVKMNTQKIKSAWSLEALQDYKNLFTEKSIDEISRTLAGELTNEAIFQLDYEFVDLARKEAKVYFENFTKYANVSKLDLAFNLVERINELAADMIAKLHNKFCISVLLSTDLCSILMAHPHFKCRERLDGSFDEENFYYIGKINDIKIFNDFHDFLGKNKPETSASMLIGVKDLNNDVNCSIIYSPYQSNIVAESDPNSADYGVFVFHSYGLTMCPQHSVESPMLKYLEFTNFKQPRLKVDPKIVKLEFGDVSDVLNIENFGNNFEFTITDDSIASFDKSSKTITAKGVEGTTDLIIKTENEEQRVIIEVSKPKITIKGVN